MTYDSNMLYWTTILLLLIPFNPAQQVRLFLKGMSVDFLIGYCMFGTSLNEEV